VTEWPCTNPASGGLVSIVGPTAVGKSAFAADLARRFGGEIISCDSMAVYRGLDIGTDKPDDAARAQIPHHLLDVAEPGGFFSAGAFRKRALEAMGDIHSRGRLCILVGGTGLYYRALSQGLVTTPGRDEAVRLRLRARIARKGPEALHRILVRLDGAAAARIGLRDSLRIVRALEVRLLTGRPLSAWISESPFGASALPAHPRVGLTAPLQDLYARIDARVDRMVERGLLDEVRGLMDRGCLTGPARKAIGYGELADHLLGLMSMVDAVAKIKLRSRRLARRQMAWFRGERGITWYTLDNREVWRHESMEFIERQLKEGRAEP